MVPDGAKFDEVKLSLLSSLQPSIVCNVYTDKEIVNKYQRLRLFAKFQYGATAYDLLGKAEMKWENAVAQVRY